MLTSKKNLIFLAIFVVVIAVGGWLIAGNKLGGTSASNHASSSSVILRLHGSNTIGETLMPNLAVAFFKQQGATDVKITHVAPEEVLVEGKLPNETSAKAIEVIAHGSSTAFADLQSGKADIGMSSRRIKPEEIQSLTSLGNMTSPASEHILALDGVAIIANHNNFVRSLTKEQIAKIFSGEINNWSEVQGTAGAIKVYRRDDKSGTHDTFKNIIMGDRKVISSAEVFNSNETMSAKVAADNNAIGYVPISEIKDAKAIAVSDVGSRALIPSSFTVASEDYLLSRRLFLYTPSNSSPLVRKFLNFATSKVGQNLVADAGFVSQNVGTVKSENAVTEGPDEYVKLTASAEKLTLNFRFIQGSSRLDNKSIADIDRVVGFIRDMHFTGESIMLFGFSDAVGGADVNIKLSKDRAMAVKNEFELRGLVPATVTGYGPVLPVASNDTADGREKNRRVEVWLKK